MNSKNFAGQVLWVVDAAGLLVAEGMALLLWESYNITGIHPSVTHIVHSLLQQSYSLLAMDMKVKCRYTYLSAIILNSSSTLTFSFAEVSTYSKSSSFA